MPAEISYGVRGRTGYSANGAGSKAAPGVLVIHEATGVGSARLRPKFPHWRTS